ncbi:MAG TPA: tetratricopeptide repeat protein [Ruminiclostridium sp.]|nr:tetratricopeptide repeat protein [Ruminiclostridium sp.]
MKKFFSHVTFIFFILIFFTSSSYAKSAVENYTWQKLNHYYTGQHLKSVVYSGKQYVAVGEGGVILSSANGSSWTRQYSGYEYNFESILWTGKAFKAVAGDKLLSSPDGVKWKLEATKASKNDVVKKADSELKIKNVSQSKMYSLAIEKNEAVAVGESGTILYGARSGQKPLKQTMPTTDSSLLDKLGNSILLCVNYKTMYAENNYVQEQIPEPYLVTSGKADIAFVPLEAAIKYIGGSCRYDRKTSTVYITFKGNSLTIKTGSKSYKLNGKNQTTATPLQVKDNVVFAPVSIFKLLGKQVFQADDLIVISDIKNFSDKQTESTMIEGLGKVYTDTDDGYLSLSQRLADVYVSEGDELYNDCEYNNAYGYYTSAEAVEPSAEIYFDIGVTLHQCRSYEEAVENYDKGLKLDINDYNIYRNKGDSLSALGEYDKAMKCFNKAYEINPEDINILISIATIDYYKKDYEKAIKGYDNIIAIDPYNITAYSCKAGTLMDYKKYEKAIDEYDVVIKLDSEDFNAYWCKGLCLYELGKYADAISAFDMALYLKPESDLILEKKGDALSKLSRYEEAVTAYKAAVDIYSDDLSFYEKCADALIALKKNDEAIGMYDKALDLCKEENDYKTIIGKKAELLYGMKEYDKLKNDLAKYKENSIDRSTSSYYLALCSSAQGRYEEAMSYVKEAISADRGNRKKIKDDDRFSSLRNREDYKELISDIKFFMDDTFVNEGAKFFEGKMFDCISFYKTNTLGNSSEDSVVKKLLTDFYEKFPTFIENKDSALDYGVYKESPVFALIDEFAAADEKDSVIKMNIKVTKPEIIMCGKDTNGSVKYAVLHCELQSQFGPEIQNDDTYNLLLKDGNTWKYYFIIN